MENIKEELKKSLKIAIKSNDGLTKNIVRIILSEISTEDIRRKQNNKLNNQGIISILFKLQKNLFEMRKAFEQKKDEEGVQKTTAELKVLEKFLPVLMTEEEIEIELKQMINNLNVVSMKDFGKIMGMFSKKFQGKADNKKVSEILRKKLIKE